MNDSYQVEEKDYAGFWVRTGALLIDVVILSIFVTIPLSYIYGPSYWQEDFLVYGFWDVVLGFIFPFVATIWFWKKYLGTPGKMAVKIEIVDATSGQPMTRGQAIGRYFAYILSAIPFGFGYLWVAIDKRKRGWHDILANTVVLHSSEKETSQYTQANQGD